MIRCPACGMAGMEEDGACPQCGFMPARIDGFVAWAPDLAHDNTGFRGEAFDGLAGHEAGHFWFEARNALIVWAMRRYAPCPERLLEIGCGTGFVLAALAAAFPEARLHGAEAYVRGLAHARVRVPRARLVQLDARALPYEDEFDFIAACDVLEHIEDDMAVLGQMAHALREGGRVLLTVPQHPWLWSAADTYARHVRRYARGELEAKLVQAGFEVLRATSFVSLLLPVMLAARWRQADGVEFDPLAEFRIGRTTNAALGLIMKLEAWCIRIGIDWPAGGSRLVLARKR